MDEIKQYIDIICDEVNIKNYSIIIGTTEKGKLELNYNREKRKFTYVLDGSELPVEPSEKFIEMTFKIYERQSPKSG